MNAEIVHRLEESFDMSDFSTELNYVFDNVESGLNEIQSQNRAILSHLGLPDPVEEAKARKREEEERARNSPAAKAALESALQTIERAGLKIARPEDDGEKK
jgi:hypothetical protein